MKRVLFVIIITLMLLTGCWSNQELNNTALVHGVGWDKLDDQIHASYEIIKPGGDNQEGDKSVPCVERGEHIFLEETTNTIHEGASELIKYTKRILDLGHTEAWIIGDKLAKDDFIKTLDIIRRDQMLRLNSHI